MCVAPFEPCPVCDALMLDDDFCDQCGWPLYDDPLDAEDLHQDVRDILWNNL